MKATLDGTHRGGKLHVSRAIVFMEAVKPMKQAEIVQSEHFLPRRLDAVTGPLRTFGTSSLA